MLSPRVLVRGNPARAKFAAENSNPCHKCSVPLPGCPPLLQLQNWIEQKKITHHTTTTEIQKVEEEKDIGVTIDSHLTFEKHISEKIAKADSMANLIRRTFDYLNADIFVPLYKALVRSHLDFANSWWASLTSLVGWGGIPDIIGWLGGGGGGVGGGVGGWGGGGGGGGGVQYPK